MKEAHQKITHNKTHDGNDAVNEKHDFTSQVVVTGLVHTSGKTQNTILQAFLMQGNFTVFLTISENSKICIEPFSSLEEVEPICEKFELCEISEFEDIKIMTDPNRQFITVIMFNQVSTKQDLNFI